VYRLFKSLKNWKSWDPPTVWVLNFLNTMKLFHPEYFEKVQNPNRWWVPTLPGDTHRFDDLDVWMEMLEDYHENGRII